MITKLQKSVCGQFVDQYFSTPNNYRKYDSAENRLLITKRVISFGCYPSVTSVKRACLELLDEGVIQRADGRDEADDALDAKQDAENVDRQAALATPLSQADANLYASLSWPEITQRCSDDRIFRFRYEAGCRLWGFRLPAGSVPEEPNDTDIHLTPDEYHAIPGRIIQIRYQREPRFRAAVQRLIDAGAI